MKYIGTNIFLGGKIGEIVKNQQKAEHNHHSQYKIVCKARGIKHANEVVSKLLWGKVFDRNYACETRNENVIAQFDNPNVKFIIYWLLPQNAITDIEIEKALKESEETE